jgi:hypothetical protein
MFESSGIVLASRKISLFLELSYPEMVEPQTVRISTITHSRLNATAVRTLNPVFKYYIKAVL